jgi:hypothetical protein
MMELAQNAWQLLFLNWPADMPRKGVLVTAFDQVPFHEFMTHANFLLVQRRAPDTVGARDVLVPYDQITGLKLTEVVKTKSLKDMGFAGNRQG